MMYIIANGEELMDVVKRLKPGDCIEIESFASVAESGKDMLAMINAIGEKGADLVSHHEGVDTVSSKMLFVVGKELLQLDLQQQRKKQRTGIEKAKEEGKYKGRKPILVDESLFEEIVGLWKNGEITARQAMARLQLKSNTFYRRIKAWEARIEERAKGGMANE